MKKIMMMLAMAATMCATVFAQNLEIYQKQLAEAKDDYQRCELTTYINVFKTNPQTFEEVVKIAKDTANEFQRPDFEYVANSCKIAANARVYNKKFVKEGYEFAKANNNIWQFYILLWNYDLLNAASEEKVDVLSKYVSLVSAGTAKGAVDRIVNEVSEWEDTEAAKKVLQKLNRKLSKNLLKDKATWEPVVAMIRTTLETY